MRDQIRLSARQWHDRGRPRGLLWREDVLIDLERWLRRSSPSALSDLEAAFVDASRWSGRRAARIRRTLALVALGVVIAFAGFMYRGLQNQVAQKLAEAKVMQSYAEQGRHALLDGKHGEALVYLSAAARGGDDSPRATFMLARATEPFLATRAQLAVPSGPSGPPLRVWSAMFSRDGGRIVATYDRGARLWDGKTYELIATLPHDFTVEDAAFTKDSTRVITASGDGFIKVWNAVNGQLVYALTHGQPNRPRYYQVAVSPDGKRIAAIDRAGTLVHVWNGTTGDFVAELPSRSKGGAAALAFGPDGRWLATTGGDDVAVFDTTTWKSAIQLAGSQSSTLSFDPSSDPSSPRLAIGSYLGDTSIWAIPSGERIHHLHETGAEVNRVTYSPDGAFVASASRDGSERVWNARTGALQFELKNHRGNVPWIEFDPSSKLVASGGADGAVIISDVAIGVPVAVLEGALARVSVVGFDPTSRRVVGASWDGLARVWEATTPYHRWSSRPLGLDCVTDTSLDGDQRFLAIGCTDNGIHAWDTAHDKPLAHLPSPAHTSEFVRVLPAISAAGDRLAIAMGHAVAVYALPGGHLVRTITHPAPVSAIAFTKSGRDIASGSTDGALFYTREGRDSVPLPGFPSNVDVVGFTPDRRLIVAGPRGRLRVYEPERNAVIAELESPIRIGSLRVAADSSRLITIPKSGVIATAVLWDIAQYRMISPLEGNIGHVFSARFVRGDREILTATNDGSPRIWDGFTGRLRQRYLGNDQYLFDATLDPEGTTVVAASGDGMLRFWDAASGRMIWTLRAHMIGVAGVHFEGTDIVTRGFTGEISRWNVSKLPSQAMIERCVRCQPLAFDENTGGLVEQQPSCDIP
jgi:WD40 repeat protein